MDQYTVVVSGYGDTKADTIGYYTFTKQGKLVKQQLYTGHENPSFLEQVGNYLITIEEKSTEAVVSSYDKVDDSLIKKSTVTLPGTDLCHISYSAKWSMIVGACYGTGDVFALKLDDNGMLKMLNSHKQEGNSEGVSRAHCMVFSQDETYVYGVNIANDCVVCYKVSDEGIQVNEVFEGLQLPKGSGPRHMKWHPTLDVAYIVTEYSNEVFVVEANNKDGSLKHIQTISLVQDHTEKTYGSTLCINQQGTALYGGNRGMDTITHMQIQKDGTLVYKRETPVYGCWPRHIALTNDDQYMMIANQKSGDVVLVKVDAISNDLGELTETITFPKVSFVTQVSPSL